MSWNFHHQNYCNASPPLRLDNNGRSIVERDTAISDRISNIEVKKYLQRILCNGYCPRPDKTCKDQLKDGLRDLISDLNMHRNERRALKKKDSNTAHMQTAIKNIGCKQHSLGEVWTFIGQRKYNLGED